MEIMSINSIYPAEPRETIIYSKEKMDQPETSLCVLISTSFMLQGQLNKILERTFISGSYQLEPADRESGSQG